MRKLIFLFILMLTVGVATKAADVTFKASAPQAVVMGEQFRLTFTVNAEGKDIAVSLEQAANASAPISVTL